MYTGSNTEEVQDTTKVHKTHRTEYYFLTGTHPTLGHYQGDSLTNAMFVPIYVCIYFAVKKDIKITIKDKI